MSDPISLLTHKRPWVAYQIAGLLFMLNGCNFEIYDHEFPHKNFVRSINSDIGKKLEDVSKSGYWANPDYLISKTVMPSGRLAYGYQYGKSCNYTYEIDPNTHIILAIHANSECRLAP